MPLISDSLLDETGDSPKLIGGRSKSTGEIIFPMPDGADGARYDPVLLKDEGKLWSYTVQRFPPKNPPYLGVTDPAKFEPFAIGYVELPGEVIVETRIVTDDFSSLKLGMPMILTTTEFPRDDGGAPIRTYAFAPAQRSVS